MTRSSRLSWLLAVIGALLLTKGSFAVYPFLFPNNRVAEVSIVTPGNYTDARFKPGSELFRLSLPRHDSTFTVVEGTTEAALRKGPGHLEGSPLPGVPGNSVIAGHRDTHFRVLKDVLVGDEVRVDLADQSYVYRIVDIRVVSPKDTYVLRSESGQVLTLITCYPFRYFGPAPERYIVQARLFEP